MFNLNKKAYQGSSTTSLIAQVVKELGHIFDVLSVKILENRKRIMALEQKIKDLESKWNIAKVQDVMSIELKIG